MFSTSSKQLQQLDLNLLLGLTILLEECHISHAAQKLCITQPAMSQMLVKLRQLFDDPLLVKQGKTFTCSPLANQLKPQLQQILIQAENILKPPQFDPQNSQGTIKFATQDYSTSTMIEGLLRLIKPQAPNLKLKFVRTTEDLYQQLEQGEVDLIIGGLDAPPASIHARRVLLESCVAVSSRDHPLATKRGLTLADIAQYPQAKYTPKGISEATVSQRFRQHNLKRNITFRSSSMMVLIASLKAGKHVGFVAQNTLTDELIELDVNFTLPDLDVFVYWHARSHQNPLHQWFRQQLFNFAAKSHPQIKQDKLLINK
ncbi:LysR family transcriptional regulator [Vibrio sp. SS-MA-C1-2]|uniref:LysR family transcriptional regulator n=1 Tax=Vibrio sp. SS-MA-C1-2 TaxID=2908646 RepID=UPI001F3EEA8B|nr:LysR family transcriptional regulator [Vibrio sp. SS-MA-C1-2]UJF16842.1 LysR family transcriptional regulator [Vibrio sp. SS-MA-C1-2]